MCKLESEEWGERGPEPQSPINTGVTNVTTPTNMELQIHGYFEYDIRS